MCWTLCARKNPAKSPLVISEDEAFKVWVIFNFLSEDKYPLIIVPEEVRYNHLKYLIILVSSEFQLTYVADICCFLNTLEEVARSLELDTFFSSSDN